jgi:adenylate kinase family enzyme
MGPVKPPDRPVRPGKIHIIGAAGSGKSFLAGRLSARTGIRSHDLDDLFWDNSDDRYDIRRPPVERDRLLNGILGDPAWIIEGVYHTWLDSSFGQADMVVYLDVPYPLQVLRIVSRFVKRKSGIQRSKKKETFRSLVGLLKWNRGYNGTLRDFIRRLSARRPVVILRSSAEAGRFLAGFGRPAGTP